MSTLLLSLLLVLLVAIGLLMGTKSAVERFENPTPTEAPVKASPTMANLLATPTVPGPVPQVDTLAREKEVQVPVQPQRPPQVQAQKEPCPACPVCPDMSQYVRLDEVPCWNCTLP